MKAIWFALVFLIFNIAMGVVVNSQLYSGTYYDSVLIEHYEGISDYQNLSKTNIEPQTTDVWGYLLNVLSFEWATQYTTQIGLEQEISPFIMSLNVIMLFVYAVALIELWFRRSDAFQ